MHILLLSACGVKTHVSPCVHCIVWLKPVFSPFDCQTCLSTFITTSFALFVLNFHPDDHNTFVFSIQLFQGAISLLQFGCHIFFSLSVYILFSEIRTRLTCISRSVKKFRIIHRHPTERYFHRLFHIHKKRKFF